MFPVQTAMFTGLKDCRDFVTEYDNGQGPTTPTKSNSAPAFENVAIADIELRNDIALPQLEKRLHRLLLSWP
jgi:hypothetical protein